MHQRLRISLLALTVAATGLAADDSLYAPAEIAAELADGRRKPASSAGFDLPFVVPETAELARRARPARPRSPAGPPRRGVYPKMARR